MKNNQKRIFMLFLFCSLFFLLIAGCGEKKESEKTGEEKETNTEEKMNESEKEPGKRSEEEMASGVKQEGEDQVSEPSIEPSKNPKEEPTKIPTSEPTKVPEPVALAAQFGLEEDTFMNTTEIFEKAPQNLIKKRTDITYGTIEKTTYYSNTCEKNRNVIVLLPDGYTKDKKYPVIYVLHGIFGNETSMSGDGNGSIRVILGNMIADGLAEDMIVVFPHMYASKTKADCTGIDLENTLAYDNFVNDLADDLMPFIESKYAVLTGRENTGLIGFSMGGRETLAITFQRPDLIGYACGISAAPGLTPGTDFAMFHPGQFSEEDLHFPEGTQTPFLLMACCGTKDSVVGTFPLSYHQIMLKNQIGHIWWEIQGSDHGDPAISSGYYNFLRYVFRVK